MSENDVDKSVSSTWGVFHTADDRPFQQSFDYWLPTIRAMCTERIEMLAVKPESPIERDYLIGLLVMSHVMPILSFDDGTTAHYVHSAPLPDIKVELQKHLPPYRVDFFLTLSSKGEQIGTIVVECDGHDFHERTKHQAARDRSRDRALTLDGHMVLRFTGSEIHNDVGHCAEETLNAAIKLYKDWKATHK
jgi:very-short-patch-repair endonuclease